MSELTLFVFRIAFLIALWVFVFFVVYAVRSDLFGQRARRMAAPARPSAPSPQASAFLTQAHSTISPAAGATPADGDNLSLLITAGPLEGERIPLGNEVITIGRASDSRVVIRDDYTSTRHAALERRNGVWMLRDLDSTNGTFLNGQRVVGSVPLTLNTTISVGQTTFEVQAES